jgi:hypothetical protein
MSNPLLKPGDPRFAKPTVVDVTGQNRFAERDPAEQERLEAEAAADAGAAGTAYSATPATSERPFQPQYETTAPSREPLLLTLAGLGLAGALCGALSLSGIYHAGWLVPLCAVFAAGPAWVLAYKDLGEMHLGGRDASGRSPTLLALGLGVAGMLACIGAVATMIWLEMSPFPDIV